MISVSVPCSELPRPYPYQAIKAICEIRCPQHSMYPISSFQHRIINNQLPIPPSPSTLPSSHISAILPETLTERGMSTPHKHSSPRFLFVPSVSFVTLEFILPHGNDITVPRGPQQVTAGAVPDILGFIELTLPERGWGRFDSSPSVSSSAVRRYPTVMGLAKLGRCQTERYCPTG